MTSFDFSKSFNCLPETLNFMFQVILNCLDSFFFWNWWNLGFVKKPTNHWDVALIIKHKSKQNICRTKCKDLFMIKNKIHKMIWLLYWLDIVEKGRISRIKTQPRRHKSTRGFMKLSYREIWTYFYQECLSFRKFMEIDLTRSTKLKASQPCQFQA